METTEKKKLAEKGDLIILTKKVCYGTFGGLVKAEIGKIFKVTRRDATNEGVETSENVHVWDSEYEIFEGQYGKPIEAKSQESGLKEGDIVRAGKQDKTVIPYLIEKIEGAEAKCVNLIDTYKYAIPLGDLYLWIVR